MIEFEQGLPTTREHVNLLLNALDPEQKRHYESCDFQADCKKNFCTLDSQHIGFLEGQALHDATIQSMLATQRTPFGGQDQNLILGTPIAEIASAFSAYNKEIVGGKIPESQFPQFVCFCQAWRLNQYFSTPQVPKRRSSRQSAKELNGEEEQKAAQEQKAGSQSARDVDLDSLQPCPRIGCSYAFLLEFAQSWDTKAFLERKTTATLEGKTTAEDAKELGFRQSIALTDEVFWSAVQAQTNLNESEGTTQTSVKAPESFNMGTVCNEFIKPRMTDAGEITKSYAEFGMQMNLLDCRGRPAFQKATHFVSHAWKYHFLNFVRALGFWMQQNKISEDTTYFWVDAFTVNQLQTQTYPQKWWSTRFMEAIGEIGNTVLVLDPWEEPVPLTRAWVIWELYCTAMTGARLHIAMSQENQENFKLALTESFDRVQTALSRVDVSLSTAFHLHDRTMIHETIKTSIGFTRMNELIVTRMLQWLIEAGKSQLQELKDLTQATQSEENLNSSFETYFRLKDNLARMMRESGNLSDASQSFKDLHEEIQEKFGKNHLLALNCLNQLAVTLQKCGDVKEAQNVHRHCLERRRSAFGLNAEETLQSASNLAVLLSQKRPLSQEDFDEARSLYEQAINGRMASVGPDHPRTLYTMTNFAKLLSEAPRPSEELFDKADSMHAHAVTSFTAKLHDTHPLTLAALHNQACYWLARGTFTSSKELKDRGIVQLRKVFSRRIEKLGREHPDTVLTHVVLQAHGDADLTSTTWIEISRNNFPILNTAEHFTAIRSVLRDFGVDRLKEELTKSGFLDPHTDKLTTGMQPFNVFARIAAGAMVQAPMVDKQKKLGKFQDRFMVTCNTPDNDEHWNSTNPAWQGKASMSRNHKFLTIKDLHWEWFNVLTFGLVSGLEKGISVLEDMKEAALFWIHNSAEDGWPPPERVGLFFHVHAHSSVSSLHLHMLDMINLGPTYQKLMYKNLSIDDALHVLRCELEQQEARQSLLGRKILSFTG